MKITKLLLSVVGISLLISGVLACLGETPGSNWIGNVPNGRSCGRPYIWECDDVGERQQAWRCNLATAGCLNCNINGQDLCNGLTTYILQQWDCQCNNPAGTRKTFYQIINSWADGCCPACASHGDMGEL